jgi:hypothetical protein
MPPDGPLGNILLHLGFVVVGYTTSESHGCTIPELITFSLSIITFSLSRTTVKVSHVAAGEHMVPGPFHFFTCKICRMCQAVLKHGCFLDFTECKYLNGKLLGKNMSSVMSVYIHLLLYNQLFHSLLNE